MCTQELQQEVGAVRRAQAELAAELAAQRALLQQLPAALAAQLHAAAAPAQPPPLPLGTAGSLAFPPPPGSPSLL